MLEEACVPTWMPRRSGGSPLQMDRRRWGSSCAGLREGLPSRDEREGEVPQRGREGDGVVSCFGTKENSTTSFAVHIRRGVKPVHWCRVGPSIVSQAGHVSSF